MATLSHYSPFPSTEDVCAELLGYDMRDVAAAEWAEEVVSSTGIGSRKLEALLNQLAKEDPEMVRAALANAGE